MLRAGRPRHGNRRQRAPRKQPRRRINIHRYFSPFSFFMYPSHSKSDLQCTTDTFFLCLNQSAVVVKFKQNGLEYITVTDNGCGITDANLETLGKYMSRTPFATNFQLIANIVFIPFIFCSIFTWQGQGNQRVFFFYPFFFFIFFSMFFYLRSIYFNRSVVPF